jgi:uncharacterized membrane protein YdjX (TVP38/TMEM64 family)
MLPTRRVAAGLAVAGLLVAGLLVSPTRLGPALGAVLASPWFPAVLVGLYLLRPLLAWPITALSVLVGYRYGLAVGVPVALAGAVLTSLVPFAVARRVEPGGGVFGRLSAGSRQFFGATGDLRGVTATRLAPTPAEAVSLAAGTAGVGPGAFVLGTLVGELPWTVAAVLAGTSMRRLSVTAAVDPVVYVGGALAAALALAGPAYRYLRERDGEAAD